MSSMSFGVTNWWPSISERMFGKRSSSVSITFWPNASRFCVVPQRAALEVVRRVLHEAAHHVLAGRRHRRVDERRHDAVDVGALATDGRTSRRRRRAPCSRATARTRSRRAATGPTPGLHASSGRPLEREVHLPARAPVLVAHDLVAERRVEVALVEQVDERLARVERAHHDAGLDLLAAREHDAGRAAAHRLDVVDAAPRCGSRRRATGRCSRSRTATEPVPPLRHAPGAERAVDLAHVVVQQHVGRAGRARPLERADDARGAHRRLQRLGLEPLVEEVGRAHRHQLDERGLHLLRQILERLRERAERQPVPRRDLARVGRRDRQDRLDEPRPSRAMSWPYSS